MLGPLDSVAGEPDRLARQLDGVTGEPDRLARQPHGKPRQANSVSRPCDGMAPAEAGYGDPNADGAERAIPVSGAVTPAPGSALRLILRCGRDLLLALLLYNRRLLLLHRESAGIPIHAVEVLLGDVEVGAGRRTCARV